MIIRSLPAQLVIYNTLSIKEFIIAESTNVKNNTLFLT